MTQGTHLVVMANDQAQQQQRSDRLARYRADPISRHVRWVCVCDGRSCEQCLQLHDQVIALDDPAWPTLLRLHTGCRCRFTWAMHPLSGSEQR